MKDDDLTGRAKVYGDMGAAGNGDVDLTGYAILHGDLYYHTPGRLKIKSNGQITGTTHQNAAPDALFNQGLTDAINASNAAGDSTTYGEIVANHIDIKHNAIIKSRAVVSE